MQQMLNLKIILGSTRPSRFSEKLVPWLRMEVEHHKKFSFEILDLRDFPMPFYDQPISPSMIKNSEYGNEIVRAWAAKIKEADAFLVVSPEYNHSVSAVIKNAFDSVYAEWNKKTIAFISYGSVGGARAVEHLRTIAVELQMAPIRAGVHIPHFPLLDEQGSLKEGTLDPYTKPLRSLLDQLGWWGEALKSAREK